MYVCMYIYVYIYTSTHVYAHTRQAVFLIRLPILRCYTPSSPQKHSMTHGNHTLASNAMSLARYTLASPTTQAQKLASHTNGRLIKRDGPYVDLHHRVDTKHTIDIHEQYINEPSAASSSSS